MHKGSVALCCLLLELLAAAPAIGQMHLWSRHFGDTDQDEGRDIASDAFGNVLVTGYFGGTADFGTGPLVSAGMFDIFVAKYAPNGTPLWSKRFGGSLSEFGLGITADAAGNILLTGYQAGGVDFGGGPLPTAGSVDVFVAKFDANGNHLWSKRAGSFFIDIAWDVAADAVGNVIVTGGFRGTVNFGGGPLVSIDDDVFLVKFDPSGNHLWSRRFGGADGDIGYAVDVDAGGNIILGGTFTDTIDFGGGPIAGDRDGFVAKFDPAGTHLWSRGVGGASVDVVEGLARDSSGNVVISGHFRQTVDFGGGNLVSAGSGDIFAAKYDPTGAHIWSKRFGGTGEDRGWSVAVNSLDQVLLSGYFRDADFGGGLLPNMGDTDVYATILSPTGTHVWSRGFGGAGFDLGWGIASDPSNAVLITGFYLGSIDFGGGPLASPAGSRDGYIARFGDRPVPIALDVLGSQWTGESVEIQWRIADAPAAVGITVERCELPGGVPQSLAGPDVLRDGGLFRLQDRTVVMGSSYRYDVVVHAGGVPIASFEADVTVPRAVLALDQNRPNPFNPSTRIGFSLDRDTHARLAVHDATGRLVRTLVDGPRRAGPYTETWDGCDARGLRVASGVYVIQLSAGGASLTRRALLVK
jgi:hypothetical protein